MRKALPLLLLILPAVALGQAKAPRSSASSGSGVVSAVTAGNGLTLSTGTLSMAAAGAAAAGAVTTGVQSFAGAKTFTGAISASNLSGTNTGDITLATVGSTPAAAGASLSSQVLTLQPADGSNGGAISLLAQTMGAGIKTFSSAPAFSAGATWSGSGAIYSTGSSTVFEIRGSKTAASGANVLRIHPGSSYAGTAGALLTVWESDNSATVVATLDKDGRIAFAATDSSGTPGAATVNKPSGQAAIAASASSVVITNSIVATTSIIHAVLQATDGTCTSVKSVVPASGSFTVNVNANCTGNTKVGWVVFN